MLDNGLFTQEELEKMDFSDLILKLNIFFNIQHEKAVEAEALMIDCEELEKQMMKILEIMLEKDPERYKQYLQTFGKEEEDAKNLDSE